MALGHGLIRVVAALVNSAMCIYIYASYLWEFGWDRPLSAGHSQRLTDYLQLGELDPAFERLRGLTFSEAMLSKLDIYMLIGTPVGLVFFVLERNRIRWLQKIVKQSLPGSRPERAEQWLEAYLWTLSAGLICVLLLAPLHLELPRAHYLCALFALGFLCTSVCIYLLAPIDFSTLAARADTDRDGEFAVWVLWLQQLVWPVLKVVLWLNVILFVAGLWKIHQLGDKLAALTFGVFETVVIVGFQLMMAVFAVDDTMVGRSLSLKGQSFSQAGTKLRVDDKLEG